jgi:hypothetical protein
LDVIDNIEIISGGSQYLNAPDLVLWNETKKIVVDRDTFIAKAPNGAVSEIEQIAPIFGLESEPHRLISINNSNGVGISSIQATSGVATCTLNTPIFGFTTDLFESGDEIFIEGIEIIDSGTGYNSEDYDYRFFKVISYENTNPAKVVFSIVDENGVGLSTNPGIAKTYQSGYATIIDKKHYPEFSVIKKRGQFAVNEGLSVDVGTGFFDRDISIISVRDDYVKVGGRYQLKKGDRIKGKISGVVAEVSGITENRSRFKVDYSSKTNVGWRNDIGKISQDYQVLPNNDYYQNLSYSIKSPITWEELSGPVNSILHPAGMKNFADVGITSSASVSTGVGGTTQSDVILDVVNERRVDVINNFDNVVDLDTRINPDQSKFLQLQNKNLTDYTECRTNRVLIHDDISNKFSSRGFEDLFTEIDEIDTADTHVRYLIQVVDPDTQQSQITELVLQTSTLDSSLLEKYTNYTDVKLGEFSANVDDNARKTLVFTPVDPYDRDHDIKILKKTFSSSVQGIGTESFGSINLVGSNVIGIGSTSVETIAEFSNTDFNGLFAKVEILDSITRELNYVEAAVNFDGTNTYLSEYYFDSQSQSYSASSVGLVTTYYDTVTGIVSFSVRNDGNTPLDVRANIIGFGTITSGIGTYRFLLSGQPAGSERSARLESTLVLVSTIRVGTFDVNTITSASSLVRVSCGSSSAIHQVSLSFRVMRICCSTWSFCTSK